MPIIKTNERCVYKYNTNSYNSKISFGEIVNNRDKIGMHFDAIIEKFKMSFLRNSKILFYKI